MLASIASAKDSVKEFRVTREASILLSVCIHSWVREKVKVVTQRKSIVPIIISRGFFFWFYILLFFHLLPQPVFSLYFYRGNNKRCFIVKIYITQQSKGKQTSSQAILLPMHSRSRKIRGKVKVNCQQEKPQAQLLVVTNIISESWWQSKKNI